MSHKTKAAQKYKRPQVTTLGTWQGVTLQVYSVPIVPGSAPSGHLSAPKKKQDI